MPNKKEQTISYFSLIKYLHPDWNPDIENPETKMEEATRYRNDEKQLYKLAVKWGVVEDDSIEKVDIQYNVGMGKLVKIDQQYEGIVVDVYEKKGHLNVVVFLNGGFYTYKRDKDSPQDEFFYIMGYSDEKSYEKADFNYQKKMAGM